MENTTALRAKEVHLKSCCGFSKPLWLDPKWTRKTRWINSWLSSVRWEEARMDLTPSPHVRRARTAGWVPYYVPSSSLQGWVFHWEVFAVWMRDPSPEAGTHMAARHTRDWHSSSSCRDKKGAGGGGMGWQENVPLKMSRTILALAFS